MAEILEEKDVTKQFTDKLSIVINKKRIKRNTCEYLPRIMLYIRRYIYSYS